MSYGIANRNSSLYEMFFAKGLFHIYFIFHEFTIQYAICTFEYEKFSANLFLKDFKALIFKNLKLIGLLVLSNIPFELVFYLK